MKILAKEKALLRIGIVAVVLLLIGSTSYAALPLSVSHALVGYTSDGPTVTLDFSLDITNNGTAALTDGEISLVPIGPANRLLNPPPEQSPAYIGNIPASTGSILVNYTIQTTFILPEEEINSFPLVWEITYTDDAGKRQTMIVESQPEVER